MCVCATIIRTLMCVQRKVFQLSAIAVCDCCVTDLNHRRRLNLLVNVKPESTKLAAEEEPAVISAGEGGRGVRKASSCCATE